MKFIITIDFKEPPKKPSKKSDKKSDPSKPKKKPSKKKKKKKKKKKRCWNKRPECGSRDYSKEKKTAGDPKNIKRKRDRREAEKNGRVKKGDGKDVSHIGGINGRKVIKKASDNRGSNSDGPGDRNARGKKR